MRLRARSRYCVEVRGLCSRGVLNGQEGRLRHPFVALQASRRHASPRDETVSLDCQRAATGESDRGRVRSWSRPRTLCLRVRRDAGRRHILVFATIPALDRSRPRAQSLSVTIRSVVAGTEVERTSALPSLAVPPRASGMSRRARALAARWARLAVTRSRDLDRAPSPSAQGADSRAFARDPQARVAHLSRSTSRAAGPRIVVFRFVESGREIRPRRFAC